MAFMTPILIALALSQVLIGLAILFESRRSKQTHQKIFAGLLSILFLWTVVNAILSYVDARATLNNIGYFNALNQLGFSLGVFIVTAIYWFNMYYPVRKQFTAGRKVVIGIGASLGLLSATKLIAGAFIFKDGVLHYEYGILVPLVVLYAMYILVAVVRDGFRLRSVTDPILRQQANTLLVGLALTMVSALLFIIVLPGLFTTDATFFGIGYLSPYFYTSFTAYGLLRQGLFNIRAVVARSAGYVFSLVILIIMYIIIVTMLLSAVFGDTIETGQLIALSMVSVLIAIIYGPTVRTFNKITNRLFYRDAYDSQAFIDEFNKILVSTIHVDEIIAKSTMLISKTLKTEMCIFILRHGEDMDVMGLPGKRFTNQRAKSLVTLATHVPESTIITDDLDGVHKKLHKLLDSADIGMVVRLVDQKHANDVMGYMVLGEKKSGGFYDAQDTKLMEIVANELVIAVQNAMRFEEIENFNLTLQKTVEERTHSLQRANEKLRQLDETKDDFISMASHQLRTPLTSIKGYISMVLDGDAGKITPMERKLLNQAFISSQRMVYLISDLLNVSRLRTGKFVIESVPTNLATIVTDEVKQLQETAKSRGLQLIYDKPADFPTILLDETKVRQVVMNFIDNAIYYTPAGGKITIALKDKPESIEFTVTDTGIGVPKGEQHKLFTKFYRADNAKRARPDGTGLGLFMAKKVIVSQGGATLFSSKEGRGSSFGFTFAKKNVTIVPPRS